MGTMPIMLNEAATVDISGSVTELLGVGTQVMNFIFSNGYLSTLFVASIVGVACYVVRKLKKTAKS